MKMLATLSGLSLLALGTFLPTGASAAEGQDVNNGFFVSDLDGSAKIVNEDGTMRDLKVGDKYAVGALKDPEVLQTTGTPPFPSFLLKKAEGKVEVKTDKKYDTAEPGKAYPFGSTLKTGRKATADFEFSPKNAFRVLPQTEVTVLPNTQNPKLVSLKLEDGEMSFALDEFPKDAKFEIQTPLGVCGAVGTGGKVTFFTKHGILVYRVETFSSVISVNGRFIQILPDGLHAGQRLEVEFDPMKRLITAKFYGKPGDTVTLRLWGRDMVLHIDEKAPVDTAKAMVMVQIKFIMDIPVPRPIPEVYNPPPIPIKPQSPAGI